MRPCSEASVDVANAVRRITAVIVTALDGGDYDRLLDRAGLVLDTRGRLAARRAPSARARVAPL
jgi:hypothetical protein